MTSITGTIFDIKKFAIHDGPGIRTTVFMKGCPLSCLWCHNPESRKSERELSFIPSKCIGCGWCFESCPHQAHQVVDGQHVLMRDRCQRCGVCAEKCYARALEMVGRVVTVEEVLVEVLKDEAFYKNSGGGMTISGGEPMAQFDFTAALLRAARQAGLHTCLDTSGFGPVARYREIMDVVDIFLYDIKDTDPVRHEKHTGVPLAPILENLKQLDAAGATTILRCPLIPGLNDDDAHLAAIAALAESLTNVTEIALLPYHPLGRSKSERLGIEYALDADTFADEDRVTHWLAFVAERTRIPVSR